MNLNNNYKTGGAVTSSTYNRFGGNIEKTREELQAEKDSYLLLGLAAVAPSKMSIRVKDLEGRRW